MGLYIGNKQVDLFSMQHRQNCVKAVSALPPLSSLSDGDAGMTYCLTSAQDGYAVGHLYKVESNRGVISYVDLTPVDIDAVKTTVYQDTLSAFSHVGFVSPDNTSHNHLSIAIYSDSEEVHLISACNTLDNYSFRQTAKWFSNSGDRTMWLDFPSDGLHMNARNTPVTIDIGKVIASAGVALSSIVESKSKLYINYLWFWDDTSGVRHNSDACSFVFPQLNEPGASYGATVSRREFLELKTSLSPQQSDISTTDWSGVKAAICPTSKYCVITEQLECSTDRSSADVIILDEFSDTAEWHIKFTAKTTGYIQFAKQYADSISGPQLMLDSNLNRNAAYKFNAGMSYFIIIHYDIMEIHELA